MRAIRRTLRRALRALGYEIHNVPKPSDNVLGVDPLDDMAGFLGHPRPLVFDVGANTGQTIHEFRTRFSDCVLHSFEPSPTTFEELRGNVAELQDVHLWNCALGASPGELSFQENSNSSMSSFLPLNIVGAGEVTGETIVPVNTIDAHCASHGIESIDILKSDTQGYDFEVLKGAEAMMRAGKISLVYLEIIFADMYKDLPSFGEMFAFLEDRKFQLVSFYKMRYRNRLASWTDALFVHDSAR